MRTPSATASSSPPSPPSATAGCPPSGASTSPPRTPRARRPDHATAGGQVVTRPVPVGDLGTWRSPPTRAAPSSASGRPARTPASSSRASPAPSAGPRCTPGDKEAPTPSTDGLRLPGHGPADDAGRLPDVVPGGTEPGDTAIGGRSVITDAFPAEMPATSSSTSRSRTATPRSRRSTASAAGSRRRRSTSRTGGSRSSPTIRAPPSRTAEPADEITPGDGAGPSANRLPVRRMPDETPRSAPGFATAASGQEESGCVPPWRSGGETLHGAA